MSHPSLQPEKPITCACCMKRFLVEIVGSGGHIWLKCSICDGSGLAMDKI